jgi:hypothetical protein
VHRIVRVTGARISTRGDNNTQEDAGTLRPGDLVGQVVAAHRGSRRRTIAGGRQGLVALWLIRQGRPRGRPLFQVLQPIYHGLARSGAIRRLLPARLRPRVVAYQAGEERQLRLLWGRRAIGRFDPQAGQWRIRPPFRLLVDQRSLPTSPLTISSRWRGGSGLLPGDRAPVPKLATRPTPAAPALPARPCWRRPIARRVVASVSKETLPARVLAPSEDVCLFAVARLEPPRPHFHRLRAAKRLAVLGSLCYHLRHGVF